MDRRDRECGLQLRARAARSRDRARTHDGQLELRTDGGRCTTRACEPSVRCCNNCYAIGWVPKPTLDSITWSGQVVLPTSGMDCDPFFDRVVTGTWLGPSAFEIESQRVLRVRGPRR